jgi:ribosome-associated protein
MDIENLKEVIEKNLNQNKASDIVTIDLKKKTSIADYMIVASGTSSRHLQSLSENLVSELKKIGIDNARIEGKHSDEWKLVDALDIIIHLFHPQKRKFYDLEKIWHEPLISEKISI